MCSSCGNRPKIKRDRQDARAFQDSRLQVFEQLGCRDKHGHESEDPVLATFRLCMCHSVSFNNNLWHTTIIVV